MGEFNSAEMAGGKAIGLSGQIRGFNADVEARLAEILTDVGRWVEEESGALMGHIKMAVSNDSQTETMNLTDLQEGVLFHGKVRPSKQVDFSFMAAVLDVDEHELEHITLHAFEESGINVTIEGKSLSHHHHHEHGEHCTCGCHDHHHHDHDDDCDCQDHHHHHHDDDCDCGCHDHDHHHHHDDDCDCGCHDHGHEHHRGHE